GGERGQTWHYPSRAECMVCHSRAANWVLGLTELQMNKVHDYGGVKDDQLRTLEHLGVFRVGWGEHVGEARRRPGAWLALGGRVWDAGRPGSAALRGLAPAPLRGLADDAGRAAAHVLAAAPVSAPDPLGPVAARLENEPAYATLLPKRPGEYRRL